jgi:hypothetical protein
MNSFAGAEYIPPALHDERYQADWVPEFSRRARGFAVYAGLRELGRRGVAELVERCCGCARLMAEELARDPRVRVLNDVVLNQVLVRFDRDGVSVTEEVIEAVQREGGSRSATGARPRTTSGAPPGRSWHRRTLQPGCPDSVRAPPDLQQRPARPALVVAPARWH